MSRFYGEFNTYHTMSVIYFEQYNKEYKVVVDTEDLKRILMYDNDWFIAIVDDRPLVLAHTATGEIITLGRFIMGVTDPSVTVTYANHNALDNRKENLLLTSKMGVGKS